MAPFLQREAPPNLCNDQPSERLSTTLCFASAKGGSGKTILAVTTAALLTDLGYSVVIIDSDFSTRGLSLFVLDSLAYSSRFTVQPENCLADSLIDNIPTSMIVPLNVRQPRGNFSIILPNSNFRRGGAPEEAMLRLGGSRRPGARRRSERSRSDPASVTPVGDADLEGRYLDLLKGLCDRLKTQFDYIIIDTRGGYDYSSKVPAILADGYVVIIEADPISVQQAAGLQSNIQEFAKANNLSPHHAGFIVNKALFSPAEGADFCKGLTDLYGGDVFGVIPADRNAIRAYQARDLPYRQNPGSDFALRSLEALTALLVRLGRKDVVLQKKFPKIKNRIMRWWWTGKLASLVDRAYPTVVLILLAFTLARIIHQTA